MVSDVLLNNNNNNSDDAMKLKISANHDHLESDAMIILESVKPDWNKDRVLFKVFSDGLSNKLIGCYRSCDPDDMVLVRVYGENSNLYVNREDEINHFKLLTSSGLAPTLYATFENGLVYACVPGEALNTVTIREPSIYPLVAITLAKFHKLKPKYGSDNEVILWSKLKLFVSLIPNEEESRLLSIFPGGLKWLKNEFEMLKYVSASTLRNSRVVFCHNDISPANIIYKSDSVAFIDYEYTGYNYQAFDIGQLFIEFCGIINFDSSLFPDKEFQLEFINIYSNEFFGREAKDFEVEDIYNDVRYLSPLAHFLWSIWAFLQLNNSDLNFDYLRLAKERFAEYKKYRSQYFPEDLS